MNVREILSSASLIPEIRLSEAQLGVPLVQALLAAGMRAVEINVRSAAGLAGIEVVRCAFPQALIGASGLSRAVDFAAVGRLQVSYGSSPGFTPDIAAAARGARFPVVPGVMTPSDVMAARAAGFHDMKFFPPEAAGATKLIRLLRAEFPDERLAVTGLSDVEAAADCLQLDNVLSVYAPWLTPDALVNGGRWVEIESLARAALARTSRRGGGP